jgi:hypothetical protein
MVCGWMPAKNVIILATDRIIFCRSLARHTDPLYYEWTGIVEELPLGVGLP